VLTIEVDRCDGCGACVEVCPEGAISLIGGVARIDSSSCIECEACVQACPNGAIKVARPVAVREEPAVAMAARPQPSAMAALAGAALSFVGRHVLPRAADALVRALDRRLSGQPTSESQDETISPEPRAEGQRGEGRRRRRRQGK